MSLADEADALAEPKTEPLGGVDIGPDGGEFHDIKTDHPITDWTEIFQRFNLDPKKFRIVDDTVRMSTWQQSRRLANGDRDVINLYSYRAPFARVTSHDKQVAELLASKIEPIRPVADTVFDGDPLIVCPADEQFGKSDLNGSTPETLERMGHVLGKVVDIAARDNPSAIVINFMGDLEENTQSTTSQHQISTNDATLSEQIRLAQRWIMQCVISLAPYAAHTTVGVCRSNHGEERVNGKINAHGDFGVSALEAVKDALELTQPDFHDAIDWVIPGDYDIVTSTRVDDCTIGFTHGHMGRGGPNGFANWVAGQAASPSNPLAHANVVVRGHYHSPRMETSRGRLLLGAGTLDNGSVWLTQQTGEWSRPCLLCFRIHHGHPYAVQFIE